MRSRSLSVAWGYMGAVIGAGFASGQELVQFFVGYGWGGLWGTVLAGVLFAVFGGLLLFWVNANRLNDYYDVLKSLFGNRLVYIMDALLAIFLFLGVCTMFSASGAVFYEQINHSKITGIGVAYIGVLMFLMTGRQGLVKAYNFLVPIKFLLLLIVAGYAAMVGSKVALAGNVIPAHMLNPPAADWVLASILYVAYNFALAMVVLSEYRAVTSRQEGISGAVIGGLMLGLVALVCYLAMLPSMPALIHYQIPMLFVAGAVSSQAKMVYTLVLWLGILTTAIANAFGFAQRFSSVTGLGYGVCLFLTVTMALPLATQSFSVLVATIYPLLGLFGLVIMIALTYSLIKFGMGGIMFRTRWSLGKFFKGG